MVATAALCVVLLALPEGAAPPGTPIVAITVIRHNVFDLDDPGTSSWPYRVANALHVVSREHFIRSLLLFKVGDPLAPDLLAESERLLRATDFLSPVTITARPAPGGAEVVVETRDQWTTEVSANFGLAGHQKKYGFSLIEDNLAGWGKRLQLLYRSEPERNSVTTIYSDPLLFGTRWTLDVAHSDASDGASDWLKVQHPFYALDTRRAGGVEWRRDRLIDYLWASGDKQVKGDSTLRTFHVWGGIGMPGGPHTTNRFTVGAFKDEAHFANWSYLDGRSFETPADRDLAGLELGFEQQSDRWQVIRGFRSWSRQEDVPLGPNWDVAIGVSLPALGGDARRLRFSSDLTLGWLHARQYSWLETSLTGRLDSGTLANTIAHLEVGSARTGAQGWRARFAADVGKDLDRENQLALGADKGLRGWDPNTFDGTSRAVTNLEYRRQLTGEVLHLGIIGMTVFADAGRTWKPRVGIDTGGVRYDAGAGLTVEVTRAAILHIIRVEVALPDRSALPGEGRKPLFLVTGVSLF